VATAESYVSVAGCSSYAISHNLTFDVTALSQAEAALRVASAYIDDGYRLRFPGYRTFRRAQGREWPRTGAFYSYADNATPSPYLYGYGRGGSGYGYTAWPYDPIGINAIPPEIVNATCLAAIREYAEPGVLQPDLERGGAVSLLKAGPVEVKYASAASAQTIFQIIDAALSGLIGVRSGLTSRATRG